LNRLNILSNAKQNRISIRFLRPHEARSNGVSCICCCSGGARRRAAHRRLQFTGITAPVSVAKLRCALACSGIERSTRMCPPVADSRQALLGPLPVQSSTSTRRLGDLYRFGRRRLRPTTLTCLLLCERVVSAVWPWRRSLVLSIWSRLGHLARLTEAHAAARHRCTASRPVRRPFCEAVAREPPFLVHM
jgi:hypothetical protein